MAPETTLNVPDPDPRWGAPESIMKKWKETWLATYRQAEREKSSEGPNSWSRAAMLEANRLFRVPELKSYEDAMKLPGWQTLYRFERDGKLEVADNWGRKYAFDVPRGRTSEKPEGDDGGTAPGAGDGKGKTSEKK